MYVTIKTTDYGWTICGSPESVAAIVHPYDDRYYLDMHGSCEKKKPFKDEMAVGILAVLAGMVISAVFAIAAFLQLGLVVADVFMRPFRKDKHNTIAKRLDFWLSQADNSS